MKHIPRVALFRFLIDTAQQPMLARFLRKPSSRNRRPVSVLVLACILANCLPTWAAGNGAISGTVTDPSGAVVPAVRVVLRNAGTQVEQDTATNRDGFYTFSTVPVGRYEIEIHHHGFRPYRRTAVAVNVGDALRLDVHLDLGEHSEEVMVSDTAIHVATEETQMGGVIEGSTITAVPLNGRSFTDLLALQPGIVPVSSQPANAIVMSGVATFNPSGEANPGNMSINGQRETANGFIVNGSDVEEDLNMGTAILPNLDSIAEFRVLTGNFEAVYGNYSGGQIIVVTKSGTSEFHGSGFEFLRNTTLDARNYFSPQRAKFDQNQFGGTLGGPIRRKKAFFFLDYQGTRTNQGVETGLISVPSLQDRSGNVSDIASSLVGTVSGPFLASQLSRQLGYQVLPGERYYVPGCVTSQQCVLPNAVIPLGAWAPPARNLLPFIPDPNLSSNQFFTSAFDKAVRDSKAALRVDVTTHWGMISAYYFVDGYSLNDPYPQGQGGASVPGFNALSKGRTQLLSLGDVTSFGNDAINDFHFSFLRDSNAVGTPQGGVGPSLASQGFVTGFGGPGIVPLAPSIEGIENIAFNNFTLGVDITGLTQHNNTFQWADAFSRVMGKHTVRFGGEFHYDQINTIPDSTFNGTFSFTGNETGSDFADFLLGVASSYTQGDAQNFYTRNRYWGLFAQDSWRARPNIVLNYGLRWDMITPWYEKYNQLQAIVPGQQSIVYPGAPVGLVFPGDPGIPRTIGQVRDGSFAPRVGVAYSPNFESGALKIISGGKGKTSLRAGYGVFYTAYEGLSAGILYAQPPYGTSYTSPQPPLFTEPFITAASGIDNGQRFPLRFPSFGASSSAPNSSINWASFEPINGLPAFFSGNKIPYAEHYMLSLERQFGPSILFTINYNGSQAHHLLVLQEANPGNAALCLSVSQTTQVFPGSNTCGPFGENGSFETTAGKTVVVRAPLGAAFGSDTFQKAIGNSNYNALEVSARYLSARLNLLTSYTYSKSIDQSSNLGEEVNPFDPGLTRAVSSFDMRHNIVSSFKYDLPLELLLRKNNRFTDGWSISGIVRLGTGFPVTLYNNNDTSLLGTFANGVNNNLLDTPDVATGPLNVNTNPRNGQPAFNTSLFSLPALGQLGTARRRFFYGPGIENCDLALLKLVPLTESKSIELRAEAFNALNHAQFYGPTAVNGNISSPDFGRIVSASPARTVQLGVKVLF